MVKTLKYTYNVENVAALLILYLNNLCKIKLIFIYNELKIFTFKSDIVLCVCIYIYKIHMYIHMYIYRHTLNLIRLKTKKNYLDLMDINILEGKVFKSI